MAGVGAGSGQAPLTLHSGVQPARRGPLGQAARRSASVSSRIRVRAIRGMAAVPARRASGASGARTVSTGLGGGGGPQGRRTGQGRAGRSHGRGTGPRGEGQAPGPLEPCRCLSPLPLQSASGASLGQGAGRRAPAPRAWPATLSAASVGSSVPLATTGRTAAKVSGPSAQVGCRVSGRAGRQAPEVLELGTASALKPGSGSTLTAVSPPWSCSGDSATGLPVPVHPRGQERMCVCVYTRMYTVCVCVCVRVDVQGCWQGWYHSQIIPSLARSLPPSWDRLSALCAGRQPGAPPWWV